MTNVSVSVPLSVYKAESSSTRFESSSLASHDCRIDALYLHSRPIRPSDSRSIAIISIAQVLESILQPFADSRINNEERKRNLEEILKRSALFAFTIFSQPSLWDFDWKEKAGVTSELCIFPALVQMTNEAGDPVRPPRSFSEAVIRRLED